MRLTDEQYQRLLPYEKHFETMVKQRWARHPGSQGLDTISAVYTEVTGIRHRLNKGCSACIVNLLTDVGHIFLADRDERNAQTPAVQVVQEEKPVVKAEVKTTTRRGGRRTKKQTE